MCGLDCVVFLFNGETPEKDIFLLEKPITIQIHNQRPNFNSILMVDINRN